ncbi:MULTISPECIES: DUF4272 domain-containing protein [Pseudoalteromonas]|uniref:DUF4272 domain-containing protein n=1 Tax=Pseudoalteromonas TaxID=53246 RepID=UPI0015FFC47D|nr:MULTISPECIES: DUF4272 domain-containing protein [Pseudoalteromonas]MBB1403895.1 DUF4272 domain-containing protein [Pseudoalteromonas sp. SG45-1]MDO6464274.1 DUF4272 domain-containing protein [Pseudoalteromonas carrageenovora]
MEDIEEEIIIRTPKEVAQRVLGVIASVGKVYFPEKNQVWIEQNSIGQYLSPEEKKFINNPTPEDDDRVNFSWKIETLVPLLWSLQGLNEMPAFNEQFDVWGNELVLKAIRNTKEFLADAKLKDDEVLTQMESFLYHQHWRVRDRDMGFNNGKPNEDDININELNSGIVYERRYGMSWVLGYGESWDDVPTDT